LPRKAPLPFIERSYRFLTYVFGGGVKVKDHEKHADSVTPIRGASIRGQLRFWWRACNPSGCKTVEELRKREGEIWGATSQASKVEIVVVQQPAKPGTVPVFEFNPNHRLVPCRGMREIAYGAFPLQPKREALDIGGRPWGLFDYGSSLFSLRLRFPEALRSDVEAALWAWEMFGGLGARTRRGFGAIAREGGIDAGTVAAELAKYQGNPRITGVPSLHGARFVLAPQSQSDAVAAWKVELGLLQRLRQGPGFGRNHPQPHSSKPAGRSRWPEADQIRSLTGAAAPLHARPVVSVERFPRAAFGMPIVFHFVDRCDPSMNLQLQPVGERDRFASPLILRPIPDGKGSFLAAALVLSSDVPECELIADRNAFPVRWALSEADARDIPALQRPGKVYTDPLQLFLEELAK
jgi:CRISPR-associated protein Cmr1